MKRRECLTFAKHIRRLTLKHVLSGNTMANDNNQEHARVYCQGKG